MSRVGLSYECWSPYKRKDEGEIRVYLGCFVSSLRVDDGSLNLSSPASLRSVARRIRTASTWASKGKVRPILALEGSNHYP